MLIALFMLSKNKQDNNDSVNIEANLEKNSGRLESVIKDEISRNRDESGKNSKATREEILNLLTELSKLNEDKLEKMRATIEQKLKSIQDDNNQKLEKMRETVDEKLHSTLEKRLSESFKQVSERLEQVHKGLGEMQVLATGVGDLKKVLSNIRSKGVFGEFQLANILEQLLSTEQYSKNVKTKSGSNAMVEFAVKLPGREYEDKAVWLPIDAKFPTENYHALMDAYNSSDTSQIEAAQKILSANIKVCAKDIRDKYLDPPNTTDFGIMFLPFEGLYAEVLRIPGLFEAIHRDYKVTISGPTTLSAILNSLQMGFRTLAIEKRSSEVWELLSSVKTEFGKFGFILEKTRKKLQEASNTIEDAARESRTIERKLKDINQMPSNPLSIVDTSLDELEIPADDTNEDNETETLFK